MKCSIIVVGVACFLLLQCVNLRASVILTSDGEAVLHYGFKTDNGQTRTEDIKYNQTKADASASNSESATSSSSATEETAGNELKKEKDDFKPVEYRGGYSFISADGYEYTVLYKANKNGFQPYVTAHKIKTD